VQAKKSLTPGEQSLKVLGVILMGFWEYM